MRSIRLISVFRSIYNHDPIFNSLYLSYFHAQCFLQHRETKLITKKISATLYLLIVPKTSFPNTTLTSPFLPPSLRKPNHRCPVTLHRPPQFFSTLFPLSPPPDNKRYHHPSSAFYLFFPPFFQSSPSFLGRMDTFARSPCGLHNGRLIFDVPSNSSARLRLLPPFLPPFLPLLPGGFSYAINRECPLLRVTHNGSSDRTIRIDRGELYIRISSGYLVIRDTWPALGYGRVTARR